MALAETYKYEHILNILLKQKETDLKSPFLLY